MNSFDFSIYDDSDTTPSPKATKPVEEKGSKSQAFDFSSYDFTEEQSQPINQSPEEESASKDPIYQKIKAPDKTLEELKNMTVSEKLEYIQDVNRQREYLSSAGFVKGALSGATFGASENIEFLKPQPHENNAGLGQFVGAAIPITGVSKLLSYPVKKVFENAPKLLKPLERFLHAFGTGATYESGVQGVNAASGNEVDLSQIPMTGAAFATIDSVLRIGGKLANNFMKLSPMHQAELLESGVVPEGLPKSQFETAEEMLNALRQDAAQSDRGRYIRGPGNAGESPGGGSVGNPLNPRRITPPQDIGLRPTPQRETPSIQDEVGQIFSRDRFYNTTQGGQALRNEIQNIDEDVYRGVNDLYRHSRELNSEINEIHPQLANRLQNRVRELEQIPEPSDVQRRLLRAANNVLDRIATIEDGVVNGYQPINNQILIDQVQSLRQIIDYDFAHGNTKNIFRPLINDIQDSALRAAESSGREDAAEAINEARAAYRTWVEAFDNDYVRPFRDASNQDFSKLMKSSLDLDESNMLRKILGITENGQRLANASSREIVEKHLSKYFENPRNANPREFSKSLRELEAVITPEQSQQIRDQFQQASRRSDFRARVISKPDPTSQQSTASRYEGKKPEDILKMMDSRSGIRQIREDFPADRFERISRQKMRSIMREGNIEKDFTGDDLYKFLNKEKNFELFSEFLGETEAENLRSASKEIGKAQVKTESRKKGLSKVLNKAATYKTISIILELI